MLERKSPMNELDSILVQHPDVSANFASGEAVLMLPSKGQIKVLNAVGSRVWQLVDGRRTRRMIIETIHSEYDVSFKQVETDTLHFLRELENKGLILEHDAASLERDVATAIS